jgi:hypothetical protein
LLHCKLNNFPRCSKIVSAIARKYSTPIGNVAYVDGQNKVATMTTINRFMSKAKYKFLRRLSYLLLLACLIAVAAVAVQPVLGDRANAFTNKPSAETMSSNTAVSSGEKVDDTLLHSTPKQSLEKPIQLAQNWQSWNGDSTWFSQNFCSSDPQSYCQTNVTWAFAGRRIASKLRITGMAAGFDTQARIVIRLWGCKLFSCAWRTRVDEILQPRTYKTWTYSDGISRTARIDPVSGESRVHLAVAIGAPSSSGSGQSPYQSFNFCVTEGFDGAAGGRPSYTRSIWANNYDEAQQKLYQELPPTGAGISRNIRRGACQ